MKVLVFPKDNNPYLEFLYKNISKNNDFKYEYLKFFYTDKDYINQIIIIATTLLKRFQGFDIYHLHFIYNFSTNSTNRTIKNISYLFNFVYIIIYISWIKIIGYKLVWTLHDITPHDKQTLNDLFITKYIYKCADKIIMHTNKSKEKVKKLNLDTSKIKIIPIGNYNSYYANNITKNEAFSYFKFSKNDFIYLFFGLIKSYKGVEDLIRVFHKIQSEYSDVKLVIAGNCIDANLKKKLKVLTKNNSNIVLIMKFIEDDKIQYFMNIANIVVLPYRKITTSSSTLLSFAFKKPIIYPRIGDLEELPDKIGYIFKANDLQSLENLMIKAYNERNKLEALGKNAYSYSQKFDWGTISNKTYSLYKDLQ